MATPDPNCPNDDTAATKNLLAQYFNVHPTGVTLCLTEPPREAWEALVYHLAARNPVICIPKNTTPIFTAGLPRCWAGHIGQSSSGPI